MRGEGIWRDGPPVCAGERNVVPPVVASKGGDVTIRATRVSSSVEDDYTCPALSKAVSEAAST